MTQVMPDLLDDEMKFIQLNAWHGSLGHNIIDFLKKEDADIVNLQEVSSGLGSNSFYFGFHERIRTQLGYKHEYYSEKIESKFYDKRVSEGLLILSKYPITYKNTLLIAGRINRNSMLTYSDFNSRIMQHIKIKAGRSTINCINYHGYFIWGTKAGNKVTEAHFNRISKYMCGINPDEKIIFSGDLNLSPRSKSLLPLSKNFTNLALKYNIKTTRNVLSVPKDPVDNIFVSKNIKIRSLRVPMLYISDHLPLIMNFR